MQYRVAKRGVLQFVIQRRGNPPNVEIAIFLSAHRPTHLCHRCGAGYVSLLFAESQQWNKLEDTCLNADSLPQEKDGQTTEHP